MIHFIHIQWTNHNKSTTTAVTGYIFNSLFEKSAFYQVSANKLQPNLS
jgi:hypothetical protein